MVYFQIFKNDNNIASLCISDYMSDRMQQINFKFLDDINYDFVYKTSKILTTRPNENPVGGKWTRRSINN